MLCAAIKQNRNIKGIVHPNTNEAKIFSHADDIKLVKETFTVLELYDNASGAKMNRNKSKIMALVKSKIDKKDLNI